MADCKLKSNLLFEGLARAAKGNKAERRFNIKVKFNFKKVASVIASTVMIGSTVALAAAANFPAPFVSNGTGNVAVVMGSSAAAQADMTAALEITGKLTPLITSASTTSTVAGGDFVQLERSSDKFNLGEDTNDFYPTLDSEELSVVLADGTYLNDANNEFDYEQSITPAALVLTHFLESKFNGDKPIIGFNINSGDQILNYTLDFTDAAEGGTAFADLENTELKMLGRSFYISQAEATSNGVKLTLLDSANSVIISEGETKTVTVNGKSYTVAIDFVEDANTAKLTINGETTNSIDEGETFRLTDGSYVGIKDVSYNSKDSGVSKVELSIGTGKLVLENGEKVELNDETLGSVKDAQGYKSDVYAYISNSSTNLNSIMLGWVANGDIFVAPGTDLIMPGFNTIKFSMGAWTVPAAEVTTIDDDGDSVRIATTIKDGPVDFSILYANSSVTGFAGLGADSETVLVTNESAAPHLGLNLSQESYFVATWVNSDDAESYVYQMSSIENNSANTKTEVVLDNLAGGGDITLSEVGDTADKGQIRFTLLAANDVLETATVKIDKTGSSGTVRSNLLVTASGLEMRLPVANTTTFAGSINLTGANPTSWVMSFYEEDENDVIAGGTDTFNVTVGLDAGDGTEPTAVTGVTMLESEDDSDVDVGYVVSPLATKFEFDNPSDGLSNVKISYGGQESYAEVFISETAASVTTSVGSTGSLLIKDNEVATAGAGKNLIVVGGSCVNTYAATLLGSSSPVCGADFTARTGVSAGQFLIQTIARSDAAEKVATLVAGYDAADTVSAAKYLVSNTVSTDAGTKKKVVSATSLTVA